MSSQNTEIEKSLAGLTAAGEVKEKSIRGGAVTLLGQGASFGLQMLSTVVMARLLSPTDYGLQGMVTTLVGFFHIVKDAGLSVATIQTETLTHEQASTLFWINTALGAAMTLIVAALGPVMVIFYKDPRLLWATVASSLVFLLNSLTIQHRALLNRSMRFTTMTKIDTVSLVVSVASGIVLAALGFRYWALVWSAILGSAYSVVAHWVVSPWRPGRPTRGSGIRAMVRFGSTVTLNSVVVFLAYNTEKILLGRFWGAESLGIYSRAYTLANLPVQQFISSMASVAFPMLSRMQSEPERLERTFLRALSLVVSLIIPGVIVCSVFADEIIVTLLGPKWEGVAPIVRWLTPTVLVFGLMNPFSWLLRSTGRVGRSLNIAFMIAPVSIVGVAAGISNGPTGVAIGYSAAMLLLITPCVAWSKHGTGITTLNYLDAIKRPLFAGAGGMIAALASKLAFQNALPPAAMLASGLLASFAIYAYLLLVVFGQKGVFADIVATLFPRFHFLRAAN